jgi:rhodanese-related sulfurtransferase
MKTLPHSIFGFIFSVFIFSLNASAENLAPKETFLTSNAFSTWQGIEPDKWATIWLIKRHIQPNAYFQLVPPNTSMPENAIAFGVPTAEIKRSNRQSMFHHMKKMMGFSSPVLEAMDQVIHDLEVNIWDAPKKENVKWIEASYRQLQARYQRENVPIDCYLTFYDRVAELIIVDTHTVEDYAQHLSLLQECQGIDEATASPVVEMLDHVQILREISLGKKIVFIDTREQEEFDEVHLPRGHLLRLRDVNQESMKQFLDADLVVPYCVKDFRGFEVAKAMKKYGIKRVATLSPNGLKGWLAAKLPVVNSEVSEEDAQAELLHCAMEPEQCLLQRGAE